jgi:hypothetical protein
MEFRGHEHVVECAIFIPTISYPFIWEWLEANVTILYVVNPLRSVYLYYLLG